VTGWGRHIDDMAAAFTHLLIEGAGSSAVLVDAAATLAARDTVVADLRALVGAVADVAHFAEVRPLTLADVVHRPAQSLHQALSALPRTIAFGEVQIDPGTGAGAPYEQAWRRAAHAGVSLEAYQTALGQLPDRTAWLVLRDLTDLAAALPVLDRDLSERLLPQLRGRPHLTEAHRLLTASDHDSLRLVTTEIRTRVPAAEPSASTTVSPPPAAAMAARTSRARPLAAGQPRQATTARARSSGAYATPGELSAATRAYCHSVSARGAHLSVPDLRAVSRLLEMGSTHAARILDRTASAVPAAADAATGLRAVADLAAGLRDAPARSMTPPHLDLIRESTELQAAMARRASQALALPGGAADADLQRLAACAQEFAEHVPTLCGALELSVREAVAAKLVLVPGVLEPRSASPVMWVTATMGSGRDQPPAVALGAQELAAAARRSAPSVRQVSEELSRHANAPVDAVQEAARTARRHAGAARAELRTALAGRVDVVPSTLGATLPAHPRATSPRSAGPRR
jgi:hypothetical protein